MHSIRSTVTPGFHALGRDAGRHGDRHVDAAASAEKEPDLLLVPFRADRDCVDSFVSFNDELVGFVSPSDDAAVDVYGPTDGSYDGFMDEVHVRSLVPADAVSYIELLHGIDRESRFLLWEPGERTIEAETLSARIAASDRTQRLQLVAEADEGLVGFLVCHRGGVRRLRHRCDFTMAIRRNQQRRGIGAQLLRSTQDWAREHGIERIELTVMANNHGAISLYERTGFTIEGVKRGAIVVDGTAIDEIVMGMRL